VVTAASNAAALPSGLVTFLFTDIEASTELHERLGDQAYDLLLRDHDELLRGIIEGHGGSVVKSLGDGLFAAFAAPIDAVRAAAAVQSSVAAHPWPGDVRLRVRTGLHRGPAHPSNGDYTAMAVHVAARVCAAAHGEQVLASGDVVAEAQEPLDRRPWSDLGLYALRGITAPVQLFALHDPSSSTSVAKPRARPATRHNVPLIRTSFVGRRDELAQLQSLVAGHRLVSVLGPGGAGKTRIAFEVARSASVEWPDGAWVVFLADLRSGATVIERVAADLGVRSDAGRPLEAAIADWCETHQALVVLDNCEHVLPGVVSLIDHLLGPHSRVSVLVTSREPLRVGGELTWRIPLLLGERDGGLDTAVQLFAERAVLADPRFDVTANENAIARLCRDLDGLPLAIEIAAARLRHMSLPAILAKVSDDRMSLLRDRTSDGDARHRTLEALLDWSYELLDEPVRRVLRHGAVFHSPFTARAAQAICGTTPTGTTDALEDLVDRSLLQVTEDAEPRYRMLVTIRDYALNRLVQAGEAVEAADRHARWVLDQLEPLAARDALQTGHHRAAREVYEQTYDDALAALEHLETTSDIDRMARIVCALWDYWLATGQAIVGRRWLVAAGLAGDARCRSRAGYLLHVTSAERAAGLDEAREACELARQQQSPAVLVECLNRYGGMQVIITEGESGEAELLEALALPEARQIAKASTRNHLGMLAYFRGDKDAALDWYLAALEFGKPYPGPHAITRLNLAEVLIENGAYEEALQHALEAVPVLEEREPMALAFACDILHRIARARGDDWLGLYWLDYGIRTLERLGVPSSSWANELRRLRAEVTADPAFADVGSDELSTR
jgi:predicted ATPase/class 3 adenylate cyclase